jgi:hypothetical protein
MRSPFSKKMSQNQILDKQKAFFGRGDGKSQFDQEHPRAASAYSAKKAKEKREKAVYVRHINERRELDAASSGRSRKRVYMNAHNVLCKGCLTTAKGRRKKGKKKVRFPQGLHPTKKVRISPDPRIKTLF